jgi:hypothetical protein
VCEEARVSSGAKKKCEIEMEAKQKQKHSFDNFHKIYALLFPCLINIRKQSSKDI